MKTASDWHSGNGNLNMTKERVSSLKKDQWNLTKPIDQETRNGEKRKNRTFKNCPSVGQLHEV